MSDMKLEQQVCSLESAKRLKELGVKQESLFKWVDWLDYGNNTKFLPSGSYLAYKDDSIWKRVVIGEGGYYSAFTVAELGEMLPREVEISDSNLNKKFFYWSSVKENTAETRWLAMYETVGRSAPLERLGIHLADTEAEARAMMLIYLLENKLK
jgi:hypothetical protein